MAGLDFNPREVLDHLHELGYTNITADQLREFIKDLKKLIKYDQRMKNGRRMAEGKQGDEYEEDSDDDDDDADGGGNRLKVPSSTPRRMLSPLTAELAGENMRRRNNAARLDRDHTCTEITANSGNTSVGCNSSELDSKRKGLSSASRPKSQPPERQPCSGKENINAGCPRTAKQNTEPTRSRSFIRPWKYQTPGQRPPGYLSNRCDPVTLYHKYQALWQQNKIPGEENHAGLRWNIRERMLGQDPHFRPVSQASSMESMNRRSMNRM